MHSNDLLVNLTRRLFSIAYSTYDNTTSTNTPAPPRQPKQNKRPLQIHQRHSKGFCGHLRRAMNENTCTLVFLVHAFSPKEAASRTCSDLYFILFSIVVRYLV